jgi:hypothetical protein
MKKTYSQKDDLSIDSMSMEFSSEEQQFAGKLYKLAQGIRPEQEFVNRLEAQIIGASQSNDDRLGKALEASSDKKNRPRLYTLAAIGFAVLAIVVVSFLTIPSLRAAAQKALGFWIKTEDVQIVPPTPVMTTVSPQEIPAIVATIEQEMEVTQQATPKPTQEKYVIKLPTRLPEGYGIHDIEMGQRGNAWILLSEQSGTSMLTLQIQPLSQVEGTVIGPDDKVVKVQIGDLIGEYVRGGWALNHSISGQIKPAQAENLVWVDDTSVHKLRWNDGNLNYYLLSAGDRHPGDQDYLGMNDLVAIAASMKPLNESDASHQDVETFIPDHGAGETDLGNIMDFRQLEALAGFDIPEATVIPQNYAFAGGEVSSIAPFVSLMYTCNADTSEEYSGNYFAFELELSKMSEEELAWNMEQFGQEEVGESAIIESIMINGVTAEYVKGFWVYGTGTTGNEKKWDNNINYQTLRWYKDGFLYNVKTTGMIVPDYHGPCLTTKEDFIAFAESLK